MVELSSPWYAVTLLGAPELWAMFAALLFVIYIGMRVINKGKKDRKTKSRLKEFIITLAPTLILNAADFSLEMASYLSASFVS